MHDATTELRSLALPRGQKRPVQAVHYEFAGVNVYAALHAGRMVRLDWPVAVRHPHSYFYVLFVKSCAPLGPDDVRRIVAMGARIGSATE